MHSQYLTTAQAADILKIKQNTVAGYIHDGKIRAVQQENGYYLIESTEVERYQRERRKRGRPKQEQPRQTQETK